jgi:hypothetical protein
MSQVRESSSPRVAAEDDRADRGVEPLLDQPGRFLRTLPAQEFIGALS